MREEINRFIILLGTQVKDVGRWLATVPADSFLKTGVMMAAFYFCGTAPTDISWVKAMDSTSA